MFNKRGERREERGNRKLIKREVKTTTRKTRGGRVSRRARKAEEEWGTASIWEKGKRERYWKPMCEKGEGEGIVMRKKERGSQSP